MKRELRDRLIIGRRLARAKPPPVLHRYRLPNDRTLEELRKQKIYAAAPKALNDPFECEAPVAFNRESLRRYFMEIYAPSAGYSPMDVVREFDSNYGVEFEKTLRDALARIYENSGIICMSAVPDSIRMWSYYAQAHQGICIGFATSTGIFSAATKVNYQNPDGALDVADTLINDPTDLGVHISLRKAAEWEFEQEYRIPISMIGDDRLMPFQPTAICEIRLGACLKADYRARLIEAISQLPIRPKLIQMHCDFERFVLTEEILA